MSHQEHFCLEYMPAVFTSPESTVILNNVQLQNQKTYQQTTGLIQRLINNTPFVDWCYYSRDALFELVCLLVFHMFVMHVKQFLCQTD